MNFRSKRTEEPDLNILPLIDVVFLLLIFFMVTTTFERESELSITLPEASREQIEPPADKIEISVDKQGRVFINDNALVNSKRATLRDALQQALADIDSQNPPVIINADAAATHQSVIRIMDVARQVGLRKVTFATRVLQSTE